MSRLKHRALRIYYYFQIPRRNSGYFFASSRRLRGRARVDYGNHWRACARWGNTPSLLLREGLRNYLAQTMPAETAERFSPEFQPFIR